MALSPFQTQVCQILGQARHERSESYVAGGVALNVLLGGTRLSQDVDLFHDTEKALRTTWQSDSELLERNGFAVSLVAERPSFVEARVSRNEESVTLQWVQDSVWRFFHCLNIRFWD